MLRMTQRFICIFAFISLLSGCGGGSSSPSTGTTGTTATGNSAQLQPGTAAKIALMDSASSTALNFDFPANAVSQATTVTVTTVASSALPTQLKQVKFAPNPSNVYVTAFTIDAQGVTVFNTPITLSGSVASTIASGTTLNVAVYQNNTWNDISTVTVGANGAFVQNLISATLPGITAPGTYVIYQPAPGTSTAVSNLGIALIADDGVGIGTTGENGLQVVNLFDANGNPLATPVMQVLTYTNAYDLDGEALTPDGSQGIMVDGGNTVRFFSKVQTGAPIAGTNTVDISAYGGDGDSVAIMPNGDEAVVSGDSATQLLVISGIASGTPAPATTITIPGNRDGVVISNDGNVLLARGASGLTVFSIAAITPTGGSLGGTISHSFTQVADLPALGATYGEDGRDGMAISPSNSDRAVVVGLSGTGSAQITLLTGLTGSSPTAGTPLALSGASAPFAVAISPDGKSAVVGTDVGIFLVSGVDTGTLKASAPYAPTYTASGTSVTLTDVPTLGITLDGKYVVVCSTNYQSGSSSGTLLVIPFDSTTASGFGTIVGQLDGIAVPVNDQMLLH
jgi:hypothetical protein